MNRPTTDAPPPCYGMSELFDATDRSSHERARAICAVCPVIDPCRARLLQTRRDQLISGPHGGPEGTWAGILIKPRAAA